MKITISRLNRLAREGRDSILQFCVTFSWTDEGGSYTETHQRAIAGVQDGKPWVRPPTPNPRFPTTDWDEPLKQAILAILMKHKLLDGLENPFVKKMTDDGEVFS